MSVVCVSDGLRWSSSSSSDGGDEEEEVGAEVSRGGMGNRRGKRPMTMQQLVSSYKRQLPVIVSVVDGFFGCYGNEIGSEEMFWICDVARQQRVLVRDRRNRYYSIPIDYQLQFHLFSDINEKHASLLSLREVMSRLATAPLPLIMLKDDRPVTFGTGGGGGGGGRRGGVKRSTTTFARLGVLEIIDAYELQYLQAHSIYESKIDSHVTSIPVFLDLSFVVAVGCLHGNDDDFRQWMTKVNAIGRKLTSQSKPVMCNEIIFLDRVPDSLSVDGCYEYMRPRNLVLTHIDEHQYEPIITRSSSSSSQSTNDERTTHSTPEAQTTIDAEDAELEQGVAAAISLPPLPIASGSLQDRRPTGGGSGGGSVEGESIGRDGVASPPPPIPERRNGKRCSTIKRKIRQTPHPQSPPSTPPLPPSDPEPSPSSSSHSVPDLLGPSEALSSATESDLLQRLIPTTQLAATTTTEGASSSSLALVTSPGANDDDETSSALRRYLFASDVPRDLDFRCLSKADVAHCLCLLDLWQFALSFESLDINGALLLELNEDILIADLGFTAWGARKLMRFVRDKWRPPKTRDH